jgi:hypothetical protein
VRTVARRNRVVLKMNKDRPVIVSGDSDEDGVPDSTELLMGTDRLIAGRNGDVLVK